MSASPATQDLTVYQGAYWSQTINWKDSDGNQKDLTGYTARMQVRKKLLSPTAEIELTTANGRIVLGSDPDFNILLQIDADDTSDLEAKPTDHRWFYDLEMVPAGGDVERLMMGRFVISLEVTR